MGQMEMKCIFNIGKNISILAKITQVSNVAHGLLLTCLSIHLSAKTLALAKFCEWPVIGLS
jgi:hypothetical protein